jgi:hypothetical protein
MYRNHKEKATLQRNAESSSIVVVQFVCMSSCFSCITDVRTCCCGFADVVRCSIYMTEMVNGICLFVVSRNFLFYSCTNHNNSNNNGPLHRKTTSSFGLDSWFVAWNSQNTVFCSHEMIESCPVKNVAFLPSRFRFNEYGFDVTLCRVRFHQCGLTGSFPESHVRRTNTTLYVRPDAPSLLLCSLLLPV